MKASELTEGRVCIRVSEKDIFENCHKFDNHMDYVKYRFKSEKGLTIVDPTKLIWLRADSDDVFLLEIYAKPGDGCHARGIE